MGQQVETSLPDNWRYNHDLRLDVHAYVDGDPLGFIDPDGLPPFTPQ